MSAALVLVWLGTADSRVAHEPDLSSWAASRMITWEDPTEDDRASNVDSGQKDDAARRVEELLAEARTSSYSGDPTAATSALDSAEHELRDHASLPQAAWLLAETWRVRGDLLHDTNPGESASLLRRAAAIDGPRAASFDAAPHGTKQVSARDASDTEPAAAETETLVTGPLPDDRVEVDGNPVYVPVHVAAGTHQIRVLRRNKLVWAGFVEAGASPAMTIPVPEPLPCSDADLGPIKPTSDGVEIGNQVRCAHFAIARPTRDGGIEVVACFGASCGTWLPWKRSWGRGLEDPVQPQWPEPKRRTWILWTAAGVVAVAAGSLALWEAGAFERHAPTRDSFVWVPPR